VGTRVQVKDGQVSTGTLDCIRHRGYKALATSDSNFPMYCFTADELGKRPANGVRVHVGSDKSGSRRRSAEVCCPK
jgi:hypothetical protein